MQKRFKYTKENGDKSNRFVYTLDGDSERIFCVDLSEFSNEEQDDYINILDQLHKNYMSAITEIGLASTFRTFLTERMD